MLETTRLQLVPLTHAQLLLYKNDPPSLYDNLGVLYQDRQHDPATIGDVAEALEFWISHTLKYPEQFEWYTNWEIILKNEQLAIGGIGFAGFPDELGVTMVGYGLDMRYHSNGYATEALEALIAWASSEPALKSIVADTPVLHTASHRVLIKNSFVETHRDDLLAHWKLDRVN
jgi:[ribosomal protein S5]-alanine N-acetyltransferase